MAGSQPPNDSRRPDGRTPGRSAWTGVIVSVVLLAVILLFILQNTARVRVTFLAWHVHLPLAVALLLALVLGAAITIAVGAVRMRELRRKRKGR